MKKIPSVKEYEAMSPEEQKEVTSKMQKEIAFRFASTIVTSVACHIALSSILKKLEATTFTHDEESSEETNETK